MIIEDQESFKAWLSAVLEPLCDADPAALAKYVFALVKKDKPAADLRAIMIEQLDVFLQQETKKFVDLLFKTLETQVYELPAALPLHSDAQSSSEPAVSSQPKCADGFVPHQTQSSGLSEPLNMNHQVGNLPTISVQTNGTINSANSVHKKELEPRPSHRKSDSDKEDKPRTGRVRHRNSASPTSRPRSRSRSRSWDRSRRSRSRERDRARERDRSRAWRNKSPPARSRHDRGGSDRRRSWSRSNSPTAGPRSRTGAGSRSRSRSPRYNHRGRYRNRSPPARSSLSRSRSRSNDRIREKKEPLSGAATPTQDSNHGDVDMRLTTTSQSIQSVVSACSKSGTENGTQSTSTPATFLPKRRCRDFDEKGYCMRGDLCPYDHGNDPVVLEDVALSRVLAFGPAVTSHNITTPAQTPTSEHVPPPTMPLEQPVVTHSIPPPIVRPAPMEYNPDAPSMEPRMVWGRTPFTRGSQQGIRGGIMRGSVGRPVPYNPQPQRELISVPVTDQNPDYKRPRLQQSDSNTNAEAKDVTSKKKTNFDFNRLGPRHKNPNNCSLELKKVPRGLNNITHLNNHFAKFGKIVNIQVSYEGDPEAAIITFSSHAEANAAYRSTEAVLNNRFIKVFWHNSIANEGKQENVPPTRPSVKERLGVPNPPVQSTKLLNTLQNKVEPVEKVIMSGNNLTKTVYIPTALKKPEPSTTTASTSVPENKITAAAAIKKNQEILAAKEILKKKQEEKRKEAVKITVELRKRKQDLLDKQLAQQKALIERLERSGPELRVSLMATIKTLQESIEAIRKDLKNGTSSGNTKAVPSPSTSSCLNKKSKEEAQREILDAELDLFTKQQEGGDTTELQKRVTELKMEAHNLGLLRPKTVRPPIAPRTTFRGRGRGFAHVSVDHRPTKVLVSGYEEDEKADVISHFSQYGDIVDYIPDDSTPSLVLNYKSRKEAEVAMLKGRNFQDRLLSVTWCTNQTNRPMRSSSGNSNIMSTVHLHHGLPHRSVVLVGGISSEGQDEQLPEDEDEVGTIELSEDVLLQDDEEEDEDGEDRSWRR